MTADHTFAVGDIHGCNDEFRALLKDLPLTSETTVVTLGDYVDRGPNSRGVIETLLELRERCHLVALRGNHEQLFLDYLDRDDDRAAAKFIFNGGGATLKSYAGEGGMVYVPNAHIDFLRGLAVCHETKEAFFVHAGVPDVPLHAIDPLEHGPYMLWARGRFLNSSYRWSKPIVHGHSPVERPTVLEHRVNLDTGCAYGGFLTAMGFPSGKLYRVARASVESGPPPPAMDRRNARRLVGRLQVRIDHDEHGVVSLTTVNFSSTGVLLEQHEDELLFALGDHIVGLIEVDEESSMEFEGHIVRRYRVGHRVCYGLAFSVAPAGISESPSE